MSDIDLHKLRDKVIGDKALDEKKKDEFEKFALKLKQSIDLLSDKSISMLEQNGIFIGFLKDIDYKRLSTDKQYSIEIQDKCKEFAMKSSELVGSIVNE